MLLFVTGFYICVDVILGTDTERYVTIETNQGTLQGVVKTARNGDEYHAFLGIPYAQPPINELRWKAPKPAPNWEGLWNATSNPSLCMQEFVLNPTAVIGVNY